MMFCRLMTRFYVDARAGVLGHESIVIKGKPVDPSELSDKAYHLNLLRSGSFRVTA